MQPLPKGVTGFDAPDGGVPVERFTTACQSAARRADGRLRLVRAAYEEVTPNFHDALMVLRDGNMIVRVLCNAHFPIVAFASPASRDGDVCLHFVDCAELAGVLGDEFVILSAQDACADVSHAMVAQLGKSELDQMRYWNPQRIGDVIFNYWD
jgi:hypothetical protein